MNQRLFSIGNFDVTPVMLICLGLITALIVAIIAFRKNYVLQVNLGQFVDHESGIHNAQGTNVVLKKRAKKLIKASPNNPPSIVIVRIDNLATLYVGYKNRIQLMRRIAEVMRCDLHEGEFITRMAFDKFCIVMTNRDKTEIKEYIINLNHKLDEMEIEQYGLYTFFLTSAVYLGVPLEYPKQDLELAMATLSYATIREDNIYFYNEDVLDKVKLIDIMNTSKEAALESNQFVPYVLPKVDFSTGKVVGGELLVRWTNGGQDVLFSPDEFIPLFESTGFIKYIDVLMFEKACALCQMCANAGHPEVVISSNFSSLTLNSLKSIDKMIDLARQYGVNPANIEIEILEVQFLKSINNFDRSLQRLKQFGFRIALDNFGRETSSLYLLTDNKFDTIKLDKLYLSTNVSSDKDKHIIKNVINLLSKLGSEVVLSGIESAQALDYLATVSRDICLEGYYFSKPITNDEFIPFLDKLYEFDYSNIEVDDGKNKIEISGVNKDTVDATIQVMPNGGTTINISGLGGTTVQNNDKEVEELRRQMDEMRRQFELTLEEQKRLDHEEELRHLKEQLESIQEEQPTTVTIKENEEEIHSLKLEIESLRNQKDTDGAEIDALRREVERLKLQDINQHTTNYIQRDYRDSDYYEYRDDEVSRLRREVDDLKYSTRDRSAYDYDRYQIQATDREREIELLQKQIDDLKENQKNQPAFDVDDLIDKLSKAQNEQDSLEEEHTALEQERMEKEDLESLLRDLQSKENEPVDEEALLKQQEEADKNLNLDLTSLPRVDTSDEEDEEEDIEHLEKPKMSLEELKAIIASYRDKYDDDWNQRAKEELQDGYYEIVNGLKYYQQHAKRTFADKMKNASPELKQLYNILKNEIMKYKGISNHLTNSYDCFYCGRKQVAKLSLTTKKVKVFLATDPSAYDEKHFPHRDVSAKKAHSRTPYYTMVKSQLSVKRINKVIADMMQSNNCADDPNYKPVDYANKFKTMRKED